MGMKSLRSGMLLLRYPVLWIAPVLFGIFAFTQIFFAFDESGVFFGEKIGIIWIFVTPFLLAGTYGCIKKDDFSFRSYIKEGLSGYFRIIIPGILLFFIAMLLLVLATLPAMAGSASILSVLVVMVILIPFVVFTFFFDTAAIFEEKKVFESIKRSTEVFMLKTRETASFFAVLFLLLIIFGLGLMIAWSGVMADNLMPLVDMSESELNELAADPDGFIGIIGSYGIMVTSLFYAVGVFLSVLVFVPYKAVFYRDILMQAQPEDKVSVEVVGEGEYDEKGRWYKYS